MLVTNCCPVPLHFWCHSMSYVATGVQGVKVSWQLKSMHTEGLHDVTCDFAWCFRAMYDPTKERALKGRAPKCVGQCSGAMATVGPLSPKALASLPATFRILVVYGQTGSGKTRIIQQLVGLPSQLLSLFCPLYTLKKIEKVSTSIYKYHPVSTDIWYEVIFRRFKTSCSWRIEKSSHRTSHREFLCQVGHYDLQCCDEISCGEDEAVCNHATMDKLQAVGLNSVPCWLKPLHCLSTGQQQRLQSAIRASNASGGIVYDDFCCYVDQQRLGKQIIWIYLVWLGIICLNSLVWLCMAFLNDKQRPMIPFRAFPRSAFSCAASIYRLVRDTDRSYDKIGNNVLAVFYFHWLLLPSLKEQAPVWSWGLCYVIVGTSRRDLIPYLGADVVIEAGCCEIHSNPVPFADRKMKVEIAHNDLKFHFGKGCSGWEGPADSAPLRKVEDFRRPSKTASWTVLYWMCLSLIS